MALPPLWWACSIQLIKTGNSRCLRPPLPQTNHIEGFVCSQPLREGSQEHFGAFGDHHLDQMLCGIRNYLREASQTHTDQGRLAHPSDEVYMVSDSDLDGLLCYILQALDRPEETRPVNPSLPTSNLKLPPGQSFDMDSSENELQKRQSTPKTTIVSQSGITEVIWPPIPDRRMGKTASRRASTDDKDNDSFIESTGLEPDWACTRARSKGDLCDSCSGAQGRGSIAVLTGADEQDQSAERVPGGEQQRSSVLDTLRKKSVALSQAMGSLVNGRYRNADYRERRTSSIFRMRAILDRLEPSRPKQNAAVFSAFTGAQPIQPLDVYAARRSGPGHTTCSEDGRQHQCVQHESVETPPG